MSWSEKRIIKILSMILAVLLAALLIVLSIRYREQRQTHIDNSGAAIQSESLNSTDYTELFVEHEAATLTFSYSQAGKWIWADDPSFPLNDETVMAIISLLDTIRPQQTLPMEGGPQAYALETPRATIRGTRADGTTRTIHLGKATTDGTSFYAMIDENQETVYILPGTLLELIQTPIYDMCELPQLPKLTEDMISSITIQGPRSGDSTPATLTIHASKSGGWTTSDGKDVGENGSFKSLLEDITALRLERCIDFAPSDNAVKVCGLTNPAAVLTVTYLADKNSEQTLKIQVGTHVTDGNGRYIRVNSDSTIYFLPTELLDPLMSISTKGLGI